MRHFLTVFKADRMVCRFKADFTGNPNTKLFLVTLHPNPPDVWQTAREISQSALTLNLGRERTTTNRNKLPTRKAKHLKLTHVMRGANWHVVVNNDSVFFADGSRLQFPACCFVERLGLRRRIVYVMHALIEYLKRRGERKSCVGDFT